MKKLYAAFILLAISSASVAQSFSSSNLPIIIINTIGDSIDDEPKIMVEMGIIENAIGLNNVNDPLNHFEGYFIFYQLYWQYFILVLDILLL